VKGAVGVTVPEWAGCADAGAATASAVRIVKITTARSMRACETWWDPMRMTGLLP
jgi:hypothetical protein